MKFLKRLMQRFKSKKSSIEPPDTSEIPSTFSTLSNAPHNKKPHVHNKFINRTLDEVRRILDSQRRSFDKFIKVEEELVGPNAETHKSLKEMHRTSQRMERTCEYIDSARKLDLFTPIEMGTVVTVLEQNVSDIDRVRMSLRSDSTIHKYNSRTQADNKKMYILNKTERVRTFLHSAMKKLTQS